MTSLRDMKRNYLQAVRFTPFGDMSTYFSRKMMGDTLYQPTQLQYTPVESDPWGGALYREADVMHECGVLIRVWDITIKDNNGQTVWAGRFNPRTEQWLWWEVAQYFKSTYKGVWGGGAVSLRLNSDGFGLCHLPRLEAWVGYEGVDVMGDLVYAWLEPQRVGARPRQAGRHGIDLSVPQQRTMIEELGVCEQWSVDKHWLLPPRHKALRPNAVMTPWAELEYLMDWRLARVSAESARERTELPEACEAFYLKEIRRDGRSRVGQLQRLKGSAARAPLSVLEKAYRDHSARTLRSNLLCDTLSEELNKRRTAMQPATAHQIDTLVGDVFSSLAGARTTP